MEVHERGICSGCDRSYPMHRLWCDHCGEGLTRQAKLLTEAEVHRSRRELNAAIHLYEQVLHDLKDLSRTDRVEPWLHGKIRDFYRNRVRQTKAQGRVVIVRKCLLSAHDMAIKRGNLEGALTTLREGLDQLPKVTVFKEMAQEIRGHMKEMQALIRASDAARTPETREVIQPVSAPRVPSAMAAEAARMRTFEARLEPFSPSFVQEEKIPSPAQRFVEGFSGWSRPLRPFLLDNAGWFVGAYSGPNRPLIPIESGHLFRGNPAGDSGAK